MKGDDAHLKDAGGKDEGLPGRGRGQHGGNHHGQELLALEAGAHLLVALAVDALEQEEFAAGPAQSVGQQAADGRTRGGQQAIEPEVALVVPDIDGQKRVHGDGDGGGIEQRDARPRPKCRTWPETGSSTSFHLAINRAKNCFKQGPLPPAHPSYDQKPLYGPRQLGTDFCRDERIDRKDSKRSRRGACAPRMAPQERMPTDEAPTDVNEPNGPAETSPGDPASDRLRARSRARAGAAAPWFAVRAGWTTTPTNCWR